MAYRLFDVRCRGRCPAHREGRGRSSQCRAGPPKRRLRVRRGVRIDAQAVRFPPSHLYFGLCHCHSSSCPFSGPVGTACRWRRLFATVHVTTLARMRRLVVCCGAPTRISAFYSGRFELPCTESAYAMLMRGRRVHTAQQLRLSSSNAVQPLSFLLQGALEYAHPSTRTTTQQPTRHASLLFFS